MWRSWRLGGGLFLLLAAAVTAVRETKYYDYLGISPDADDRTIQKAYRRAALKYHPDRNPDKPDAEERFREVAAAYEVLSDAQKKEVYDRYGEQGLKQGQGGGGGGGPGGAHGGFHFQGGDPFNIFENVFGGGGGGGGGQRMHFQFNTGGGGGGGMGGGMGGGGRRQRESAGLYDNDAFVQDLSDDTFPEGDGDGWIWLIEFYAPWCGHCKQLALKWRKLAEALHGVVKVAAVNCEQQQAVCQEHGVRGYPTIKAFSDGKLHEYRGDRSAKHLKDWALSLLPKHVKTVSKQSHLSDFLRQCTSGGGSSSKWGACALLLSDKSETSSLYKSLALRYKGKLAFGEALRSNAEISATFGVREYPTLLVVCGGNIDAVVRYEGEMKSTKLARFLNQFYSGKACAAAIKIDASTDLAKMRVSQLKQILESRGEQCKDCVEKSDFVDKIRQVFGVAGSGAHTEL
ncbi:hypothetical protein D9Q98_005386 [Chlorella vulgaris]|uniref:DnaJ homolog subfamily C member 10 n=1 Tax=Chlorella vulgaris TaxID=3077 RepID=A0A9D4TM17_CHLVU|nr:hypothetical protein D9Q98_005386 [Chlorella vulgaris]